VRNTPGAKKLRGCRCDAAPSEKLFYYNILAKNRGTLAAAAVAFAQHASLNFTPIQWKINQIPQLLPVQRKYFRHNSDRR
jgi:hypothetical protein